jgi:hypothetical protein
MLQQKIISWAIAAVIITGACFVSNQWGYTKGVADTKAKQQTADIAALNKSIGDLNEATKKAGDVNLQLSNTISTRQKADADSTRAFKNALSTTAHLRVNCVFDSNIMQQLSTAADRADKAAGSGFGGALPTGDPPSQ